ncbi:MAG: hypothetical protein CMM28_05410 [Rhodospirillaceae bacterium]|nr:hypothetical protein [Rhodospirillaceae bacterium]|tara:strand:+ start:84 stop:281 length:198 start_codon:yes stop_codon:yes gene_type:complete
MKFTKDDIRTMSRAVNLEVTNESDLDIMAIRLSSLLEVMETIEQEMGEEMNQIDPVPPVYPKEPF